MNIQELQGHIDSKILLRCKSVSSMWHLVWHYVHTTPSTSNSRNSTSNRKVKLNVRIKTTWTVFPSPPSLLDASAAMKSITWRSTGQTGAMLLRFTSRRQYKALYVARVSSWTSPFCQVRQDDELRKQKYLSLPQAPGFHNINAHCSLQQNAAPLSTHCYMKMSESSAHKSAYIPHTSA